MPITPLFRLTQDDAHVVVEIRAPYMRPSSMEFDVDGCEFRFYAKPQYFLRLTFESGVEELGDECAKYDVETGVLTVRLRKAVAGRPFQDLDMLSKLLAPPLTSRRRRPSHPPAAAVGIEELDGGGGDDDDGGEGRSEGGGGGDGAGS